MQTHPPYTTGGALFISCKIIFLPSASIQLAQKLRDALPVIPSKHVTAGFDGFIDSIVRIIATKSPDGIHEVFATSQEFGNYILSKAGSSFAFETEQMNLKLGGNLPIMANALGSLGIHVDCIGALGYPVIHPLFTQLPATCVLHSFCKPGTAVAYEFNDGKIIWHRWVNCIRLIGTL